MKNKNTFFGIIAFIAIIGLTFTACGDDEDNGDNKGGYEFYAVHYTISDSTYDTLESSHNTALTFSTATLAFVAGESGSIKVAEKKGTAQEVTDFLKGLSLTPMIIGIPEASQLTQAKVGAISAWWNKTANPNYFIYVERTK